MIRTPGSVGGSDDFSDDFKISTWDLGFPMIVPLLYFPMISNLKKKKKKNLNIYIDKNTINYMNYHVYKYYFVYF